jgi:2-iminobutanoate/2-iminopropanoate deaminase
MLAMTMKVAVQKPIFASFPIAGGTAGSLLQLPVISCRTWRNEMNGSSKALVAVGLAIGAALLLAAAPAAEKKALMGAAKPVGPYSPGVDIGNLVFVAGQIGLDPASGKMVEGGIDAQTTQVMKNAEAVLKNAGLGFKDVVRTTVFLTNIGDFQAINKVYASYFPEGSIPPARSTVGVASLAAGAVVEIDFIAAR